MIYSATLIIYLILALLLILGLIKKRSSAWALLLNARDRWSAPPEKSSSLQRCQLIFSAIYGENNDFVQRRVLYIAIILNIPTFVGITCVSTTILPMIFSSTYWESMQHHPDPEIIKLAFIELFVFIRLGNFLIFLEKITFGMWNNIGVFMILSVMSTILIEVISIYISRKMINLACQNSKRRYILYGLFIILFFIYFIPLFITLPFWWNNYVFSVFVLFSPLVQGLTALILLFHNSNFWPIALLSALSSCIPVIVILSSYLAFTNLALGLIVSRIITRLDKIPAEIMCDIGNYGIVLFTGFLAII